jgi:hypothetical protein
MQVPAWGCRNYGLQGSSDGIPMPSLILKNKDSSAILPEGSFRPLQRECQFGLRVPEWSLQADSGCAGRPAAALRRVRASLREASGSQINLEIAAAISPSAPAAASNCGMTNVYFETRPENME